MKTNHKLMLGLILTAFSTLNLYALATEGLLSGIVAQIEALNGWGLVITCDLVIALSLVCAWMVNDAKKSGRSALPYVMLTVATGSIGPLVYMLGRRPS